MEVLHIEALAALKGLELAKALGYKKVVLESDSAELIGLVNNANFLWNPVGTIIQDIANICPNFNFCSFQAIGRDGNKPAHVVIREIFVSGDGIWLVDPPPSLLSSISDDFLV